MKTKSCTTSQGLTYNIGDVIYSWNGEESRADHRDKKLERRTPPAKMPQRDAQQYFKDY